LEPSARFEQVKVPLGENVDGLEAVSAVIGMPEWWPTGSRVGIVLAHGATGSSEDPLLVDLHRSLTERKYLTLRFNFPFAEAGRKRPDPPAVLERALRAAVVALARDPTAAPAHLFVLGKGLGARVAADVARAGLRVDGLILLGYPLSAPGDPKHVRVEHLFRIVSPMFFIQGTRDKSCDVDVLRRTLTRVGAPTALHVVQEGDQHFKVPRKASRTDAEVRTEIIGLVDAWIHRVLGE
jgi:hypothetical protein